MNLAVKDAGCKGRGVFAAKNIKEGHIIEKCPILIIPSKEEDIIDNTIFKNYWFNWEEEPGMSAIALGYGSLYNHSYNPNAIYKKNIEKKEIEFISLKNIEEGEEITINYNGYENDKSPLWFDVKEK
jgi:uncharacterized protein